MEQGVGVEVGPNGVERFQARLKEAEDRLEAAENATKRLSDRISEGRAADDKDVAALDRFAKALASARDAAKGYADGAPVGSVAQLRAVAESVERSSRVREEKLREALERVCNLPNEQHVPSVAACKDVAQALKEPSALDDPDAVRQAEGLLALIDMNSSSDIAERAALEGTAVAALPQNCLPAVGLANMGMLESTPETAASEPPAESHTEISEPEAAPPPKPDAPEAKPKPKPREARVDVPEAEPGPEPEEPAKPPSQRDVEQALEQLLEERRYGLAHWVTVASGEGLGLDKALIAIAYANAMASPVGESAGRLRDLVNDLAPDELDGDKAARLIALVAGLRASLLAPHSSGADLLEAVSASFAEPPGLRRLVETVIEAGRTGFSPTVVTIQAKSITATEDDLAAVRARARDTLKHRTIKYQRASNVWRKWVKENGLLGGLLSDVVENRTDRLEEVEARIFALRSAKVLAKELEATDRALRAAGRQTPITDKARAKLIEGAEEALDIAAGWVEVSRRLDEVRTTHESADWQRGFRDRLRSVALEAREEIGTMWDDLSRPPGLLASAATGTRPILEEVFGLVIEGESAEGPEPQVDEILGLDLLRVEGLAVDDRLEPADIPTLESLLRIVNSDEWTSSFDRRLAEGSFGIAARIVQVLRRQSPEDADRLEAVRLQRLEDERRHLRGSLDEAARRMEAARRQGRLQSEDALSLSNELSELALDGGEEDLGGIDGAISDFRVKLEEAESVGRELAREKYEPRLASDLALQEYRERFERLLDAGEISTLEELVLAVERGNEPPTEPAALFRQLTSFFPGVVDDPALANLPSPGELGKIARERGELGKISFANLRDEEIETVEAVLEAWRRLGAKDLKRDVADLTRVLEFVGLTVEQDLDMKLSAREQRSFVVNAEPFGKALAPAFGSEAKGLYRVLPIWEQTTDDALVGMLSQVAGDEPIVVICPGSVIRPTARRGIADQLRHSRQARPVALIDDATVLYLASRGGRNLATTMRITLPFTAIDPYTPFVSGSVPVEMFYGRHQELAEVINPVGTCFIYGGRRLGKSALLRAAEREVNAEGGRQKAIYIDLKTNGIGEWRAAEEIIEVVNRALIEAKVMTSTSARAESQGFDLVREQVKSWLEIDSGRRILLLLDECDSFLNADAEDSFRNVSRLKSLMEETGRAFKPVFAGLHQVNRFQQLPNQPLAHLGKQIPIGPLTPQRAYELITKPMEALGYKFDEDSGLPERILTTTNYQPSLIQIFCSELVKYMLDKHARGPETPPYPVTSEDVEHVYQAPHVVEEMRGGFEVTINLDPRYRVIAYVVALEASEGGAADGLASPEIRAACEEYWPEGFAKTRSDEFRALLEEMDSLGVLFKRGGTYLMRSPSVLRMLGTGEQIEERLYDAAEELEIKQEFEATSFRDAMGDDGYRRRPLTHQQVASMLERHQQRVHVVVGSAATDVDNVLPCLSALFESEASAFNFVDLTGQDRGRVVNRFRKPAQKKVRVVHFRVSPEMAADALGLVQAIEEKIFAGDSPSTAIIVIGTEAMPAWRGAVAPKTSVSSAEAGEGVPRFELVELGRWTEAGLRAWAQAPEVHLPFFESQQLRELMAATGGWPLLVDRVVNSYKRKRKWQHTIEEFQSWLESAEGAATLCEAIGFDRDPAVRTAWDILVELDEPVERELFQELLEMDPGQAAGTLALLRSMQVLDFEDGCFVAEPTAARAWKTIGSKHADAGS